MKSGILVALATAFYLFVVALFWPVEKKLVTNAQPSVDASGYQHGTVIFSDASVRVSIPTTTATQQLGLGGRTGLSDNEGMYWVYDLPERPTFWMHGMLIPLDFVWVRDGQIVDLREHVPAPDDPSRTDLPIIQPIVPATGVLEVADGYIARHGLMIGEVATLDPVPQWGQP